MFILTGGHLSFNSWFSGESCMCTSTKQKATEKQQTETTRPCTHIQNEFSLALEHCHSLVPRPKEEEVGLGTRLMGSQSNGCTGHNLPRKRNHNGCTYLVPARARLWEGGVWGREWVARDIICTCKRIGVDLRCYQLQVSEYRAIIEQSRKLKRRGIPMSN